MRNKELMKRILVTGGAGFLGANLCERLIKDGFQVICLDNYSTGRRENIVALFKHPNFIFIEHDITNPFEYEKKIDQIYNMACPASPQHYQGEHAVQTSKTCFLGALNLLELAKKHKATILQASTSEVYGEPLEHPQKESYRGNVNPIGIRACYDEGKRIAESLFFDFYREESVEIKIVRIFNTYGPKMNSDDGRVVSNFIWQALTGKPITIYGDGSQTRSFCYVDDLIDVLLLMMNSSKDFIGPVNIGNPDEFTIKELAEKVIEKTGYEGQIIYKSLPADDPTQRKPDISLATEKLGWVPKYKLDEGLDKLIESFRNEMKN